MRSLNEFSKFVALRSRNFQNIRAFQFSRLSEYSDFQTLKILNVRIRITKFSILQICKFSSTDHSKRSSFDFKSANIQISNHPNFYPSFSFYTKRTSRSLITVTLYSQHGSPRSPPNTKHKRNTCETQLENHRGAVYL